MDPNEQKKGNNTNVISPLANDKTFGEKVFHGVFDIGINFGVNLLVSAGFTYWVNHSLTPVKLPFMREPLRPAQIQLNVERGIGRLIGAHGGPDSFGSKAAKSMAGVATLTAAGHAVMIPSVWLGAKIKAPMVRWLNAWHYGQDAMEDPSIKARHDALEIEERPTLFGTVVGRFGTILATQTTAYLVGHNDNIVRLGAEMAGFKWANKFQGIDAATEAVGNRVGGMLAESMPNVASRINTATRNGTPRFGYSYNQIAAAPRLEDTAYGAPAFANGETNPYGGFFEHFGRYVTSDILYTAVTSVTITPAINFLKHYIPGMTYTPKSAERMQPAAREQAEKLNVKPVTIRSEVDGVEKSDIPQISITSISHLDRVADAPQREVSA